MQCAPGSREVQYVEISIKNSPESRTEPPKAQQRKLRLSISRWLKMFFTPISEGRAEPYGREIISVEAYTQLTNSRIRIGILDVLVEELSFG